MCWGGGKARRNAAKEAAREKEKLLVEWSDDDEDNFGGSPFEYYHESSISRHADGVDDKESSAMLGPGAKSETLKPKKAAYVPQYAAQSFLRTATPRRMRRANEVL